MTAATIGKAPGPTWRHRFGRVVPYLLLIPGLFWLLVFYVLPAIQMFKPLAAKGNAKAQHVIGVMYEKGQGVARNSVRALAWFSVAAKKGDREAKAKMQEISKTMTPDELSQARAMAVACEASDYRGCEY